jgi:hypothetical protein
MDTTKKALQSAPSYTYDRTKGVWEPGLYDWVTY